MNFIRGKILHEGKANTIYEVKDRPFFVEMDFTDRISAGNGTKKAVIKGKGITNKTYAINLFTLFSRENVPTHCMFDGSTESSIIVQKADMIPLEVIGRFIAAGSFCNRYNISAGTVFDSMIFELCYKNDNLGDPFISESAAAYGLKLASISDIQLIQNYTQKIGIIAQQFFKKLGLTLVDFKVEFGFNQKGKLMLCDEFSLDTCRLLDENGNSLDKDIFRKGADIGNVEKTYQTALEKLLKQ